MWGSWNALHMCCLVDEPPVLHFGRLRLRLVIVRAIVRILSGIAARWGRQILIVYRCPAARERHVDDDEPYSSWAARPRSTCLPFSSFVPWCWTAQGSPVAHMPHTLCWCRLSDVSAPTGTFTLQA